MKFLQIATLCFFCRLARATAIGACATSEGIIVVADSKVTPIGEAPERQQRNEVKITEFGHHAVVTAAGISELHEARWNDVVVPRYEIHSWLNSIKRSLPRNPDPAVVAEALLSAANHDFIGWWIFGRSPHVNYVVAGLDDGRPSIWEIQVTVEYGPPAKTVIRKFQRYRPSDSEPRMHSVGIETDLKIVAAEVWEVLLVKWKHLPPAGTLSVTQLVDWCAANIFVESKHRSDKVGPPFRFVLMRAGYLMDRGVWSPRAPARSK